MVTHTLFPVLRLMSTSSGDSALTLTGEAEIHYNEYCSEDEIDFCKENVTGRHIQEPVGNLQQAAECAHCLEGKLKLWQAGKR